MKTWIAPLFALCLLPFGVSAADDGKKDDPAAQVAYINLVPALVGNFGEGPKLRYFKADIALRVTGSEARERVTHHEPLIRNQLVMLFSQQTEDTLGKLEAKEALRQEALKEVQRVISDEEGKPLVDDLLFNNLIVQ